MRMQPLPIMRDDERAWFTWDDPMTAGEVQAALRDWDPIERRRLLARILREAKDTEVWSFTTLLSQKMCTWSPALMVSVEGLNSSSSTCSSCVTWACAVAAKAVSRKAAACFMVVWIGC